MVLKSIPTHHAGDNVYSEDNNHYNDNNTSWEALRARILAHLRSCKLASQELRPFDGRNCAAGADGGVA